MNDADWLRRNKPLRLDANETVFDAQRRSFHLERYHLARTYVEGRDVLDLACGTGYGSAILAEAARSVTGVDFSSDAVAYARKKYASGKVRFEVGFAELTTLVPASFDAVVSFETLEHLISPEKGIAEYRRLMRPDAMLIASVPNNWGYTSHHFVDFNYGLLREMIGAAFGEASYFYQNSGRKRRYLPGGIGPLTAELQDRCECLLVVASRPMPLEAHETDGVASLLEEIYKKAFERHRDFLRYEQFFRKFRARRIRSFLKPFLPGKGRRTAQGHSS